MKAKQLVASLLEEGPDEVDPKKYALQFDDPDRLAELKHYVAQARRSAPIRKAAYPSDSSVIPCTRCGNPHHKRHGLGTPGHDLCPPCSKDDMRTVADVLGWKWPRQKIKREPETPPKAMMLAVTGGSDFPIAGGGQG